jgi:hypothetical protein
MRTVVLVIGLPLVLSLLAVYLVVRVTIGVIGAIFGLGVFLASLRTPRVIVRNRC